ncbi:MAG: hypothetical protein DYG98_13755 [Haliscomenobacteraceae bacterium CHB4]|nr:hypothetical protein [Haliscomenobacteraceae bacterium CHB4]
MEAFLKNWHFMRLLRAGVALWAFAEVWRTGEWLMLLPGSIFALQAIFDIGCCGAPGCAPPIQPTKPHTPASGDVIVEEVRSKQQ